MNEIHSELGASNCERWWNCPGSVELIRKAPPEKPNFYAAEGTVAHAVAHSILGKKYHDSKLVEIKKGSVIEQEGFKIKVDDKMLEAVQVYIDYIDGIVNEYELAPHNVMFEKRVSIPSERSNMPDFFGTADTIIHIPYYKLIVADYKHGAGNKVYAFENKQTKYYLTGALYTVVSTKAWNTFEQLEGVIVQPRCVDGGIESQETTVPILMDFRSQLIERAKEVRPGAPLTVGPWCKYCPAREICPERDRVIKEDAAIDFQELAMPYQPGEMPLARVQPALPSTLTVEQTARILELKPLIIARLEEIENFAFGEMERGVEYPGWGLVPKRSNREWIDENAAIEFVTGKWKIDTLKEPKVLSPNQVEQKIKAEIKQYPEEMKDFDWKKFHELWHKPDNGLRLAKVDSAKKDFGVKDITDDSNGST